MDITQKTLSDIVVYNKYAKYIPSLKRRETWNEIVTRYLQMMIKKYPSLESEIVSKGQYLYNKKVLMSMRAAQFAGQAIEKNHARGYNCSYLPIDHYAAFSEICFLLLGGTGAGYSVQNHHIEKLPEIRKTNKTKKYLVGDSIEGWADAVKALMKAYFGYYKTKPLFDFSDIRPKGSRLITAGGKAPGPEPLRRCLFEIELILERKQDGEKLTSVEVHDIVCHIADAVLAGGIRRAALISLFDADDVEMRTCKTGAWWELNPQRGRANNSAVLLRHKATQDFFLDLWKQVEDSNAGEPGLYFSNDKDYGANPCCFTGDMKLKTDNGYEKIENLAHDEIVNLVNVLGEIVEGTVWNTGKKQTINLKLSNGKTLKCTPDHRLMLNNGEECLAENTLNLRLKPYIKINEAITEFTKYGFIQGDGSTGRLDSSFHKGLEIYFGEKDGDVAEIFGLEKGKQYVTGFNNILKELEFDSNPLPKRSFPKTFQTWNKSEKLQFLKGLYSANGCVIKNNRVSFKTTSLSLATRLVNILREISIEKYTPMVNAYITTNKAKEVTFSNGNYLCKESYDVNISRIEDIKWFTEHIGFIQDYKQRELWDLIITKAPKVISITSGTLEDVYDFSLNDNTHWGVVEGIIAHNCEISLRPFQFCNLTEINGGEIVSEIDFYDCCGVASFFGTLQAGFTDFHYLRDIWKTNTEKDALIGVGITGIANGNILELMKASPNVLKNGANIVKEINAEIANKIGINIAARTTTVKPSGTTSCVVGTSSGIHAWHSKYYIRNMQCTVGDDLYNYFLAEHPELIKIMDYDPRSAVIGIPQRAPETAIFRDQETAIELLERVKQFNIEWVKQGHRKGPNTNNVSATISIKQDVVYEDENNILYEKYYGKWFTEWEKVGAWMWENRNFYNGLSVLPYDGGSYKDAPFIEIDENEYISKLAYIHDIDLTKIIEDEDHTTLVDELACAGGACEIL